MALNRYPAGTLAVLVDETSHVQMVGKIYGYGDELHQNDPNYNVKYWENVIQFREHSGYGLQNQQVYAIESIPEGVAEPWEKWLYTEENGFAPNPDYREPSPYDGVPDETIEMIQNDTIEALVNEVSEVK